MFVLEAPVLRPLPDEPFGTGCWFTPQVDRFSQNSIRTNRYSVPVRLIARRVRVLLHASDLIGSHRARPGSDDVRKPASSRLPQRCGERAGPRPAPAR
ncbi:Mu transposase domain-containing protein [Amycolatopsis sp. NPDC098790]|uniref:Mu transposase domain-containing protein n=1 Tax=Amycolatopsis sp. NPDC098790 TaxID=3363939 RepID=UPI00382D6104